MEVICWHVQVSQFMFKNMWPVGKDMVATLTFALTNTQTKTTNTTGIVSKEHLWKYHKY